VIILYLENSFREKFGFPLMDTGSVSKSDLEKATITKEKIQDSIIE
jgi:hypothetical protein